MLSALSVASKATPNGGTVEICMATSWEPDLPPMQIEYQSMKWVSLCIIHADDLIWNHLQSYVKIHLSAGWGCTSMDAHMYWSHTHRVILVMQICLSFNFIAQDFSEAHLHLYPFHHIWLQNVIVSTYMWIQAFWLHFKQFCLLFSRWLLVNIIFSLSCSHV